ncbi:hypothetical protein HUG15_19660 [Salicibibacter cibarius]|uniref:Uncharacterized protein n=1 Tax=Salicibibacter cibarius TaxID=2743000 RepID=A0A7T6Z5W6_9BACI|nr:hypothetical protein [Salicibibacter cibarius]QQK77580.1 hypothetical protein HUG15_19660 [Salicibibacter cibarius]
MDRWEAVHDFNPDIPYPDELISSGKWPEVGEYLSRLDTKVDYELSAYIFNGTIRDDRTVEEVANGVE